MDGLETFGGKAKDLWETGADIPFSASSPQWVWEELTEVSQAMGFSLSLKGEFADKTQYREWWTFKLPIPEFKFLLYGLKKASSPL